jgi:diguanylate cyclase (GGDEF)-like protein
MSLRVKFGGIFALIVILAVGLAAYGIRALSTTGDLVVRLYDEPLMSISYARAASATLNNASSLMERALRLDSDQPRVSIEHLAKMEADIDADLRIVRLRAHNPSVVEALEHAQASVTEWFTSGRKILSPPPDGATTLPTPAVVRRQNEKATNWLDDLVEVVAADGFTYRSRAIAEMGADDITLVSLSVCIVIMSALFMTLFAHLLIGPIQAATSIAEEVAAGQLENMVTTERRDEIGRLLTSLGIMQTNLRDREVQAMNLLRQKDQTTETLRQINLRFDAALNNMPHGLVMCNESGQIVVMNRRFSEIYRIDPDHLGVGCAFKDVLTFDTTRDHVGVDPKTCLPFDNRFMPSSNERSTRITTIADGRTIAVSYEPMQDGGWITIHEDITERRRSEEQVIFLARHDALTGLANRVKFLERLDQALALAERGNAFALLCLDLDGFKAVNDTFGHPIGDGVLKVVADRLLDIVRESDIVARLGGDEFAILQLGVSTPREAAALARRIVRIVGQPYEVDGHRATIGTSIGITLIPSDGMHQVQVLKNADLALYRAKQDGRGTWRFFEQAMDDQAKARREMEVDLRSALSLGQFELHYQPVVCARRRTVTGFEALLRWRHPTRGIVPPSAFIPVAEEIGLVVPIGAWVLNTACAEATNWPDHLRVAINLSPIQFRGQSLVDTVTDVLQSSGIASQRLELEITESVLLQDNERTKSILKDLRALGTRIALDDFGTGYSSLSYLHSFPFDTIKIDRCFVSELPAREECATIIHAIIGLGKSLHMHTTAEGVETEEQLELLAAAGCTEVQGYYFSKPVPAPSIPELIRRLSSYETVAV